MPEGGLASNQTSMWAPPLPILYHTLAPASRFCQVSFGANALAGLSPRPALAITVVAIGADATLGNGVVVGNGVAVARDGAFLRDLLMDRGETLVGGATVAVGVAVGVNVTITQGVPMSSG